VLVLVPVLVLLALRLAALLAAELGVEAEEGTASRDWPGARV